MEPMQVDGVAEENENVDEDTQYSVDNPTLVRTVNLCYPYCLRLCTVEINQWLEDCLF